MLQCKRIARAYFSKNRKETLNRYRGPPSHSNPIFAAFPHATTGTSSREQAVGSPAQLRFLAASEPHIPVASGTVIPILRHDCSCRPQVLKCLRMQISSDRDAETAVLPVKSKIGRDQDKVPFWKCPRNAGIGLQWEGCWQQQKPPLPCHHNFQASQPHWCTTDTVGTEEQAPMQGMWSCDDTVHLDEQLEILLTFTSSLAFQEAGQF